jgi:hypothetical protein
MARYIDAEVYVVVDEDGNYEAAKTAEAAFELYGNDITVPEADGNSAPVGMRVVKVKVRVPVPAMIEVAAVVSEEEPVTATAG